MYYQVIIETNMKVGQNIENNIYELDKTDLTKIIEQIIKPFLQKKEFRFNGYLLNSNEIKRILVKQSEKETREIAQIMRNNNSLGTLTRASLEGSPYHLVFNNKFNEYPQDITESVFEIANAEISMLNNTKDMASESLAIKKPKKIFIGHGQSHIWLALKDYLTEELLLEWDEFNREPMAGIPTSNRLEQLLDNSSFAFLVMTAEDEYADSSLHARENVIHEAGLFQGRLGLQKAIILLEDGCEQFSNIHGLTHIPFKKGKIDSAFYEIRRVLKREGLVN